MIDEINFERMEGFEWDRGNSNKQVCFSRNKNWSAHRVSDGETEEIFFHEALLFFEDTKHSDKEKRYYALGQTNDSRKLFCAFTVREDNIRIISARDMSKRERARYANATKKHSKIS